MAIALVAWLVAGPAKAAGSDPSDLWWNAAESGWGMQLIRGGDATFATLFVYDAGSRPTFYTASLAASGSAWSGPLYETSGSSFASVPYDPGRVSIRIVGTLTFTPTSAVAGELQYTVDSTRVTKNVTRQTLRLDDYSGRYPVTTQRVTTHCPDAAANGDRVVMESVAIDHRGTVMSLDWTSTGRTCRYDGAYMQAGRLGATQATYVCSDGENGDFVFFELVRRDSFITGRFQGHSISNGCDYRGQFAGILPN